MQRLLPPWLGILCLSSVLLITQNVDARRKKPSVIESWYFTMGLAYTLPDYSGDDARFIESGNTGLQAGTSSIEDSHDSHITLSGDVAGVYWPFSNWRTLYGVVVNSTWDAYQGGKVKDMDQLLHLSVLASGQHFFTSLIGKGPFARADAGMAHFIHFPGDKNTEQSSRSGIAYGIGGGWAFPLSKNNRIQLSFLYHNRMYNELSLSTYQLMLSGLW